MFSLFRKSVLLIGALTVGMQAQAQSQSVKNANTTSTDIAITYSAERGKVASVGCGCFWLQGGSVDGAITFFHGLGIAADLTGAHVSNVTSGVDLDKISFMMGPRYTYRPEHWKYRIFGQGNGIAVFAEGLIGGVHGFNSVFPSSQGIQGTASSFGMQAGGGLDWTVTGRIRARVVQAEYVRSTLPNNSNNTQNDLRISGGIVYHFRR